MPVVIDAEQLAKVRDLRIPVLMANAAGALGDANLGTALDLGPQWSGTTPVTGPETPIVQMATSGTVGKPKVVVHPLRYAAGCGRTSSSGSHRGRPSGAAPIPAGPTASTR